MWWQFRIGQEKSTLYDKALLLLGNRLENYHPKSTLKQFSKFTDSMIEGKGDHLYAHYAQETMSIYQVYCRGVRGVVRKSHTGFFKNLNLLIYVCLF